MTNRKPRMDAGVAVGPDSVTIVALRSGRFGQRSSTEALPGPIVVTAAHAGEGPDDLLREAIDRLRTVADGGRLRLHVALLAGLAEWRLVTLPPLRAAELALPIRRDVSRYFPGARQARVAGAWRVTRDARASWPPFAKLRRPAATGPVRVLAGAVPATILELLLEAAHDCEAEVVSVVPAAAAWAAGATSMSRCRTAFASAHADLVLAHDSGQLHLLVFEDGVLVDLRRRRAGAMDRIVADVNAIPRSETNDDNEAHRTCLTILADASIAGDTTRVLKRDARDIVDAGESAAVVAARYAHRAPAPGFVPDAVAAEARRWADRLTGRLAAAAVVMLALAGAVEIHGIRRELSMVRELRSDLAPRVAPALAVRDSLERAREQLAGIEGVLGRRPTVTELFLEIALLLPKHAYLTDLAVTPDTIRLDGVALRAAEALQGLRSTATFAALEFQGAIRRELRGDSAAIERFAIAGPLASPRETGGLPSEASPRARQ